MLIRVFAAHWAISTWAIIVTLLGKNIAPHINELLGFMTVRVPRLK